jgi:hypothetical protein
MYAYGVSVVGKLVVVAIGHPVKNDGMRGVTFELLSTAIVLLTPPAVGGTSTKLGGAEQVCETLSHVQSTLHDF